MPPYRASRRPPSFSENWETLKRERIRVGSWSTVARRIGGFFLKERFIDVFSVGAFAKLRCIYRRVLIMANHYLRTELYSEIEPVELAWDALLRFDNGPADRSIVEPLLEFFSRQHDPWVLVGVEGFARYIANFASGRLCFEEIIVPGFGSISETQHQKILESVKERLLGGEVNVFLCLADRFDASHILSALPCTERVHTFDLLKELLGERIPPHAWRKKFEHIYPIDLPTLEVRKGLDVLLADLPARSLAQLPIGFAYVYKSVREAGVNVQAIDVDLIAYHRYHARRCLNYVERVHSDGMVHPEDPWQAENYIVWTDKKFVNFFTDILDELTEKIIEAKPKVVGFSLHQTSTVSVTRVVERLRRALPDTYIIVGGMSCYQHFVAKRIFPLADYVVVGEADTVVGPLVAALVRGEQPRDVPGVVSRYDSEDREFVGAPLPHNLDIVGAPDYGFTNLDWYVNWNGYRLMPLVGSRGCGWSRCTFCAERFNWRARTPELVAEEIEHYTTRGFKDFVFNESDFNSNLSFVVRLCNEIVRRGIKANFTAQLRIGKDCDFEYYKTMKTAGFSCLRFGVDGLSENTLRLQRKGYTKEMVMQNLKHCHDLGIYTEINVVIGVPGETEADVEEAADFIIQMKPYIGRVAFLNPLMLFVGSVYYFEPEKHNIKFRDDKDQLYKQYFVSLPDAAWYSENPYIDHEIRRRRFFRIVERIHNVDVPLGAFAKFTAEYRKEHNEDSHTVTQPQPARSTNGSRESAASEAPAPALHSPVDTGDSKDIQAPADHQKTEFQKTFYGAWSTAFLSGASGASPLASSDGVRVAKFDGGFYLSRGSVVRNMQVITRYPVPQLLGSYKDYNLVGYRDQILGAPLALGELNLADDNVREDPRILKGHTQEEVVNLIDVIEASRHLVDGLSGIAAGASRGARKVLRSFTSSPSLLRTYKKYNLVAFREQILGAPLSMGHVDLNQEAARADPRIIKANSEDEVVRRIDELEDLARTPVANGAREIIPSPAAIRKVNMKAGVLLRWGK
jgi:radical SAM superfamily enzyme YgiQ (UPF0313 family)